MRGELHYQPFNGCCKVWFEKFLENHFHKTIAKRHPTTQREVICRIEADELILDI